MWLYICLMLYFIVMSAYNGRSKQKMFVCASILIILMGFKDSSVGNDTLNYIWLFNSLKNASSMIVRSSRFEPGYQLYNKLIGILFNNSQMLFVITAVICICCITYGLKKCSRNWMYSLFLFVGLRFYYFFLSGLRQSIAVSIVFVAYTFLKDKKYVHFVALIALATTFHFSAAIFLLALPLSRMKMNSKSVSIIVVAGVIVYIFFGPLLSMALSYLPAYYSHYVASEAASANNLANYIGAIIPCVFLLFAYLTKYLDMAHYNVESVGENSEEIIAFYDEDSDTQLLFVLMAALLSFVATRASILDRMVQYFWIFSIISIPNMIFSIRDQSNRTLWFLIISFFIVVYNIVLLVYRPEWTMIIPYKFFW